MPQNWDRLEILKIFKKELEHLQQCREIDGKLHLAKALSQSKDIIKVKEMAIKPNKKGE